MAKRKRPIEGVQRRYSWRLYPTQEQNAELRRQAAMCADLWNALLSMCEERYRRAVQRCGRSVAFHCPACASISASKRKIMLCEEHHLPDWQEMGDWITEMLAECPEWRELSTWTPRQVAVHLDAAWKAFFRRVKAGDEAGYPRYKSRRKHLSIPGRCCSGWRLQKSDRHETSWWLYIQGISDKALWRRGRGRGDIWARGALPASVNEWTDADIQLDDRGGEISVAVAIDERRQSYGRLRPVTVRFDLIDGFVLVNNVSINLPDLIRAKDLDDRRAEMQAEFDLRWPRGKRWSEDEWRERNEQKSEIGRLASRIARIRRNALHVWSCQLVERASVLTIYKPRIKDNTKTPRGDAKNWGAAVSTVSTLNREVLSYAPAMAAQMLEYKATEIGIPVTIMDDPEPGPAIGAKLVSAEKATRKLNRAIRKNDNEHDQ